MEIKKISKIVKINNKNTLGDIKTKYQSTTKSVPKESNTKYQTIRPKTQNRMRSSLTITSQNKQLPNSPQVHKRTSSTLVSSHPTITWTHCSHSIIIPQSLINSLQSTNFKDQNSSINRYSSSHSHKLDSEWELTKSALQSEISYLRNQLASSQLRSTSPSLAPGPSEQEQISELCRQLQRARSELKRKDKELQEYKICKQVTFS